jgi:succinate dehydrogenase/fumarate reductase-like Fe-S protein
MKMIAIYIMGKKYLVPEGLTIMRAMEHAGYRFIRGCGCRSGFCGACGTVYRKEGDYRLKVGLACQTLVEDGMHLVQIPFFPANKAIYKMDELSPLPEQVHKLYPEIFRCVGCNSCTKICPQEISVMDYMSAVIRGDIEKAADLSFDCIQCGLCAARCPAETVQYNVAILCRRIYGKYIAPKAPHLSERIEEIKEGKFDNELSELMKKGKEELRKMYAEREIEPE